VHGLHAHMRVAHQNKAHCSAVPCCSLLCCCMRCPVLLCGVLCQQSSGQVQGLLRATSCYSSAYLVLDLSSRPWRVLHMNEPAVTATGEQARAGFVAEGGGSACLCGRGVWVHLPCKTMTCVIYLSVYLSVTIRGTGVSAVRPMSTIHLGRVTGCFE
jgi:hypothetical protein